MKLLLDNNNNILFRTTIKENKDIKKLIEHTIINNSYQENINFIKDFDEIEAFCGNGGDVYLYENIITISGDNGLIDIEIIDLKDIEEL